jgi:L-serine deaminase
MGKTTKMAIVAWLLVLLYYFYQYALAVSEENAAVYARMTDGHHFVHFDKVIRVMKETGHDLPSIYKETAEGGLAKD